MKNKITTISKITVLGIILGVGMGYVIAYPTTPPGTNPNVSLPITITAQGQAKAGRLTVGNAASGTPIQTVRVDGGDIYADTLSVWYGSSLSSAIGPVEIGQHSNSSQSDLTVYGHIFDKHGTTSLLPGGVCVNGAGKFIGCPFANLTVSPVSHVGPVAPTLTWTSGNGDGTANNCTVFSNPANPQWTGTKQNSGSQGVSTVSATTTFTLICSGVYDTATLTIN